MLKKKLKLLVSLLVITLLISSTAAAALEISMRINNEDKLMNLKDKLNNNVPKLMKKYGVPGAAVAVIQNGEIAWTKDYGYADKAGKKLVDKDTIFQIGSISKPVAAWGVMKLVEEGKIDIDAPIEKYLTRWHLPESKFDNNGVTIRRILSHTAGLSLQGYGGDYPKEKLPTIEQSLSGKTNGAGDVRVVLEPGTQFKYSGGGYTLLQLLIEEVSKMPFEKYMEQEILKPLGMNDSAFEWKEEFQPRTAKAYGVLGELPNYLYTEKAAAGLYTTSSDLAKFVSAAMSVSTSQEAGRGIIKPETVSLMLEKAEKARWGLGYQIDELSDGIRTAGHGGANRGWRAEFWMQPDKKNGIVVLTNSDTGGRLINDILAFWIESETGSMPGFYNNIHKLQRNVLFGASIFGILFIVCSSIVLLSIKNGKRIYLKQTDKAKWKKVLRITLPLLLGVAWFIGFYVPIIHGWSVAGFMPAGFGWITLAFMLWCLLLIVIGAFPKVKSKSASKDSTVNG